jgi:CRP-like cAMP-binding protein
METSNHSLRSGHLDELLNNIGQETQMSEDQIHRDEHLFQGNRVLAALSADDLQNFSAELRPVLFHVGEILFEPGSESDTVYFPKSGIMSLVLTSSLGIDVEVGLVGSEGAIAIADALIGTPNVTRSQVQIAGSGWRISAAALREEFARNPQLQTVLLRYQRSLSAMAAQNTLCNRLHSIEQRLAKWLLLAQDRVHSPELELTHEFLADMLGARRSAVTLAAQSLRQAEVIDYRRGVVTILDRSRMEHITCECYSALQVHSKEAP